MIFPSPNLNVPHLPELIIDRVHLLEKLHRAVQRKLTLIVAPPGYGKTTLVTQFAQAASLPLVWHSIEERERDLPNLLAHCLKTFAEIFTDGESFQDIAKPPSVESAISVTEHLRHNLTTDIVYVMDNVHHLVGSPGCEAWLRAFIVSMPSTCHLILIGRMLSPLPIAEMVARREVQAIGHDDLRFTFQEITDLTEMMGSNLSAGDVHKMISRLNGWPAGTLLALQPLPAPIEMLLLDGKSGPEALFDSLAATMLENQPAPLKDFLLASSTLSQMTPTNCEMIFGLPDSLSYLTEALHRNLFISQISGGMAYHPLFRDFLQRYLQTQDAERFIWLHAQAGQWFEANNRLENAFDHYIQAQYWNEAARLVENAAQTYLAQGKAETVLYWNMQLSRDGITAPKLHYTAAMIQMDRYQYDQAKVELDKAIHGFQATMDETGLIQVALLEANIQRQRGKYQQAIEQAEGFVDQPSIPENMRGYAGFILGTAYLELGNTPKALQYLENTLPVWRAIGDAYSLSQLLLSLDVTYTRLGKFIEAAVCGEEVVNIQRALGKSSSLAMALNNLGYHYHLLGNYQAALNCFEEGLQVIHALPEKRNESYIQWSLGDLQRDRRAFPEAMTAYQKAFHLADSNEPILQIGILLSIATLHRWKSDYLEALSTAQQAAALAQQYDLSVDKLRAEVAVCAIRSQQGDPEAVLPQLEIIMKILEQRRAQTRLTQALGISAQAALQISDTWAVHQYLKRAITSVDHPANLQPLVAEIIHTPALKAYVLGRTQQYEPLVQAMRKLEAVQVQIPELTPSKIKAEVVSTYSLRVWMLGQEQVERDGILVATAIWQAESPRQLFFYLLLKGPASREQIGLVFWPDSSNQEIRRNFHNLLSRARVAVGSNTILFEDNMYRINPDIDVWCDVLTFETLVQQVRLMSPRIAHTQNLLRQAVNLYKGDLLPASDNTWMIANREALRETYMEALLALGNSIHIRGKAQEAIAIYKRALDADPFREDIYRALITCYADIGQLSLIRQVFERLTQFLQTELGIDPSPETITLVQTLLN